ncbi:hypothetical protein [Streptomyces sp. NRRL F-5702]|uniref:hypothetical protein n=1 Tax=Streptomyces sp. NRRL F-5702 TaxID=1463870 RepID=UPI00131C865E|nr:hypothetical protein [Streptomyces sp. NRRL F-5702]
MPIQDHGSPNSLTSAEAEYAAAVQKLHREEVAATIRNREGLHYASVGEERSGPNLVAHNGNIIGETHTESPGILHDWYAVEADGKKIGPFVTARAAAAGLIKE